MPPLSAPLFEKAPFLDEVRRDGLTLGGLSFAELLKGGQVSPRHGGKLQRYVDDRW